MHAEMSNTAARVKQNLQKRLEDKRRQQEEARRRAEEEERRRREEEEASVYCFGICNLMES
jgi:hypothetical protein